MYEQLNENKTIGKEVRMERIIIQAIYRPLQSAGDSVAGSAVSVHLLRTFSIWRNAKMKHSVQVQLQIFEDRGQTNIHTNKYSHNGLVVC